MSTQQSPRRATQGTERNSGRRAWAGNPPHAEAARQRLLEAAARCIAREGIAAATVAAVAAEAGVSRQTVYRYFRDRDQLVLRSMRAAAEGLRAEIDRHTRALADPADVVVEALVVGLEQVRSNPVLRAMWDPSRLDGSVIARITGRAGIEWLRTTLARGAEATRWGDSAADARLELILRIFLSLIISPSPERSPEELRAFLHRHLIPGLGLAAGEEM